MAGTVTVVEATHEKIKMVEWTWTSTAGGAADLATSGGHHGEVAALVTNPDDSAAPTDNYDITITDDTGRDILHGVGANRDTSDTETAYPSVSGSLVGSPLWGTLTLNVTNAGNAKSGVATLFYWG